MNGEMDNRQDMSVNGMQRQLHGLKDRQKTYTVDHIKGSVQCGQERTKQDRDKDNISGHICTNKTKAMRCM